MTTSHILIITGMMRSGTSLVASLMQLFAEFWHQLLPNAHFLFVFRHPLDVLQSLMRVSYRYDPRLSISVKIWNFYHSEIKAFCERHRDLALLCHTYGIIDNTAEFAALLRRRFQLDLNLDRSTVDSLYHPDELRRVPVTSEVAAAFRKIRRESAELYEQLNALADLPFDPGVGSIHASPELDAFARLVSTFPRGSGAPRDGRLLPALMSFLDPEVTETWFAKGERFIGDLQEGNAWLRNQRENWMRIAEEREQMILDLKAWIEELEKAKEWWAGRAANWQRLAEERGRD